MKPVRATVYELDIPFVLRFAHSTAERASSDAVVVRVESAEGATGFGEGLGRPYVTGETQAFCVEHIRDVLWPSVAGRDLPTPDRAENLGVFDAALDDGVPDGVLTANASRSAIELALIDCALVEQGRSLGDLWPPGEGQVRYSAAISATSPDKAAKYARKMALFGLTDLKVKVGLGEDRARLEAVLDALGPGASVRIDANGVWTPEEACAALAALADLPIQAVEAPIARTDAATLAAFRERCPFPIVADESLVTLADARDLALHRAVDFFNVRVSKLGGLWRARRVAEVAREAGIGIQVGAQVGETAILSAAGRHLAASLAPDVRWVEGSYGTFLLSKDVSRSSIAFGAEGLAPVLTGPGLGIDVLVEVLEEHARRVVRLEA